MKFYPEEPLAENASQHLLWMRLREAFTPDEGVAYYEYPVSFPDGFKRYGLDAVMVRQREDGQVEAYVFETRGCSVQHIQSIQGETWLMREWPIDRERPHVQVNRHVAAFRQVTSALLGDDAGLEVTGFVVLPRVTRAQITDCP